MNKLLLLIASVLILTGCATALIRGDMIPCGSAGEDVPPLYPATCVDFAASANGFIMDGDFPSDIHVRLAFIFGGVLDLPFSVVCDTLFLPYDCYKWANDEESNEINE